MMRKDSEVMVCRHSPSLGRIVYKTPNKMSDKNKANLMFFMTDLTFLAKKYKHMQWHLMLVDVLASKLHRKLYLPYLITHT